MALPKISHWQKIRLVTAGFVVIAIICVLGVSFALSHANASQLSGALRFVGFSLIPLGCVFCIALLDRFHTRIGLRTGSFLSWFKGLLR